MKEIRAITFDCWGTLLDNNHAETSRRIGYLAQTVGCSEERANAAFHEAWTTFREATAVGLGLPPIMLLNDTLDRLGYALRPPEFRRVLAYWEEHVLQEPPDTLPGARDVLVELRARGYRIGLISDTGVTPGRVVSQLLAHHGLRSLIDWLTFSDQMGVCKAHAAAFTATCAAMDVAPSQALHVGDSPDADIDGAQRAGLQAALVLENTHRDWGRDSANLVLERLADLPGRLQSSKD